MAEVQTHTEAGEMTQVFIEFVMMQSQNAALFLGQIPNPRGQEVEINLPLAKMFIDQLATIREKTKGNLNSNEQKVIDSAVRELQLGYVEVAQLMRAQNIGADIPGLRLGAHLADEPPPAEAPAPPATPVTSGAPAASEAPAAAAAPTAPVEAPREEAKKKFTKSYGA